MLIHPLSAIVLVMTDSKELDNKPIKTNNDKTNGEYVIINEYCGDYFVKKVNELCKLGYAPAGGVSVSHGFLMHCRQAMYKKDSTE